MKSRIALISFLLVVVSIVITLNLFFHSTYESEMATQINQQQLIIVKTLAFSISTTLRHFEEEIKALAGLLAGRGLGPEGLAKFVDVAFEEINEDVRVGLAIFGPDGQTVYKNMPGYRLRGEDRTVFETLQASPDPGTVKYDSPDGMKLNMMAPIVKEGRTAGAVMIVISIDDLNRKFLVPIRTGQRGHAWIMDNTGTLIYHPTMPEMVGKNINSHEDACFKCHESFKAEKNILKSSDVGFSSYIAPYGEDKLIAFSRVEGLDWIICQSIPYSEVTAQINRSMKLQSAIVIFIMFSTVLVALVIIVINRERVRAEAKAGYADKIKQYASELERVVESRTEQLRAEKEKLDLVVESVNAGMAVFEESGRMVWANRVMKVWLGRRDISEFTLKDFFRGASGIETNWNAVVTDSLIQETVQLDLGAKKGHFQMSLSPIHISSGEVQLMLLLQDVTDLKMAEEQMIQSERLASLSRLSAGVAHEIGNPLTSISSYVQILADSIHGEFETEAIETVMKHVHRIDDILRKMSSFTRGGTDLDTGHCSVKELIDSTVELVRYDKRTKGLEIRVEMPGDLPHIKVNSSQMMQVIMNLVLNAADSVDEGGVLWITARRFGGNVEISLRDNGSGISEENLARIFEPFFTTKKTGTGLGLAVSHGIVKSFGGSIDVLSTPEEGTEFIVRLPAHEAEEIQNTGG